MRIFGIYESFGAYYITLDKSTPWGSSGYVFSLYIMSLYDAYIIKSNFNNNHTTRGKYFSQNFSVS